MFISKEVKYTKTMNEEIVILTKKELESIQKTFQSLTFNSDFDLVYESQTPNTGVILLSGEIELIKNNQVKMTLGPGCFLGFYSLLNNEPSEFGFRVKKGSKIILIQKLEMIIAVKRKKSPLHLILKKNCA